MNGGDNSGTPTFHGIFTPPMAKVLALKA
jgi:hypothetical protein